MSEARRARLLGSGGGYKAGEESRSYTAWLWLDRGALGVAPFLLLELKPTSLLLPLRDFLYRHTLILARSSQLYQKVPSTMHLKPLIYKMRYPPNPLALSVKLRLHPPIPDPVHLELEPQPRAINRHLEREVEVVKLNAPRGSQPREQAPRHGVEVRRERAHVREVACVGRGRVVGLGGDEVVRHHEGLARAEVPGVVEGDGLEGGDRLALVQLANLARTWLDPEKK